jgi:hypothetical protein
MYVCIDVITANVRTEIVEGKSIALSLGGGMVLPHFCPIVIVALLKKPLESAGRNPFLPVHQASQGRQERIPDDARRKADFFNSPIVAPMVRQERPIDRSTRIVCMPFRGVRHFTFANRTSTLLHFCNNFEIAPFFFRTRCRYLRTTVGEIKKHSDRTKERWSRCCSYTLNRVHTGELLPTKTAGNILSTSPISRW